MDYALINSIDLNLGKNELTNNTLINEILDSINDKLSDSAEFLGSNFIDIKFSLLNEHKEINKIIKKLEDIMNQTKYHAVFSTKQPKTLSVRISWHHNYDEDGINNRVCKSIKRINKEIKKNHLINLYNMSIMWSIKRIYMKEATRRVINILEKHGYCVFVEHGVGQPKLHISWYTKYSFWWFITIIKKYLM